MRSAVYLLTCKMHSLRVLACRAHEDTDRYRTELRVLVLGQPHSGFPRLLGACALPPHYALHLGLEEGSAEQLIYEKSWRPSFGEALSIARQMASALDHLHNGLRHLHRDVKPGNILVTRASSGPIARLSDFGLAVREGQTAESSRPSGPSRGRTEAQVGTLPYLAPELLSRSAAGHSRATDVYALGVTLNELLTGIRPYSDSRREDPQCHTVLELGYGSQELAAAIAGWGLRPTIPAGVPLAVRQLIESCWCVLDLL